MCILRIRTSVYNRIHARTPMHTHIFRVVVSFLSIYLSIYLCVYTCSYECTSIYRHVFPMTWAALNVRENAFDSTCRYILS